MSFNVVRIENSAFLSQFEMLPNSYVDEDKKPVLITRGDESARMATVDKSNLLLPYTVQVTSEISDLPKPHVKLTLAKHIIFYRYPKAIQSVLLKEFFNANCIGSGYKHLNSYQCSGKKIAPHVPDGIYYIKPEYGARSLSIIEIDTSRLTIDEFFGHLNNINRKVEEWAIAKEKQQDTESKKIELSIAEPRSNDEYRNKLFLETLDRIGVKFKAGDENYKDEAITQFYQQSQTIQEKCMYEDLVELRVIRSMNGELLIVTREDLKEDWHGTTTIVTDQNFDKILRITSESTLVSILDNIREALSHPLFPGTYGSIDVWISPSARSWGIFEFQPQYDGQNIPAQAHQKFMRNCINEFIAFAN